MKNLFFAFVLCAFVATPAFASNHGHADKKEDAANAEEQVEQPKAPKVAAANAKKKKRTAKKVVTETQEMEEAPAEATHN